MLKVLNTLRWVYVGFLLGATTMCYLISEGEKVEEKEKLKKKSKYDDPDWVQEKMYGEYSHA